MSTEMQYKEYSVIVLDNEIVLDNIYYEIYNYLYIIIYLIQKILCVIIIFKVSVYEKS